MNTRLPISLSIVLLFLAAAALAQDSKKVAAAPKPLTEAELADGWISLFDGETLFGWKAASKADWQVKDGAIVVSGGEKGLLCTTVEFDNYVLKADFRAAKDTNSGIFLRTAPVVGMNDITTKCYELNIAPPDNPFPTGSFVGRRKARQCPSETGEWQSYEVTLDGAKVDSQAQRRNGARIHRPQADRPRLHRPAAQRGQVRVQEHQAQAAGT